MYRMTIGDNILRLSDNSFIPKDGGNIDYQQYLAWLAAGNNPAPIDFSILKGDALDGIERSRDAKRYGQVAAHGRQWQADANSQDLIGKAVNLAQAGLPLPTAWRDADNSNMPISSINDLLAIAGSMAAQTQAAYTWSWGKKGEVELAATTEELSAIDFND